MMALYKQRNVNPVAGCLPIPLQMPIWIALYRMLSNAGGLYQQPFIPGSRTSRRRIRSTRCLALAA